MRPAKNLVFYQTLAPAARNCGGRGFSRTDLIETRGLRVAAGSRNCAEARVRAINCGTRGFAQLRAIAGFAAFFFLSRLSFQRFLPRPIRNTASREHFSQLKGSPPRAIARGGDPFSCERCSREAVFRMGRGQNLWKERRERREGDRKGATGGAAGAIARVRAIARPSPNGTVRARPYQDGTRRNPT